MKKDKANLLIDDDQGETVFAQVVFDANCSAMIGWAQYDIRAHQLFNTSAISAPQSAYCLTGDLQKNMRVISPRTETGASNRISSYLDEAILGMA